MKAFALLLLALRLWQPEPIDPAYWIDRTVSLYDLAQDARQEALERAALAEAWQEMNNRR